MYSFQGSCMFGDRTAARVPPADILVPEPLLQRQTGTVQAIRILNYGGGFGTPGARVLAV